MRGHVRAPFPAAMAAQREARPRGEGRTRTRSQSSLSMRQSGSADAQEGDRLGRRPEDPETHPPTHARPLSSHLPSVSRRAKRGARQPCRGRSLVFGLMTTRFPDVCPVAKPNEMEASIKQNRPFCHLQFSQQLNKKEIDDPKTEAKVESGSCLPREEPKNRSESQSRKREL